MLTTRLVSLITDSPEIEELMITEYPDKLLPNQCLKVGDRNNPIYLFRNLNYIIIKEFLRSKGLNSNYEIRDN